MQAGCAVRNESQAASRALPRIAQVFGVSVDAFVRSAVAGSAAPPALATLVQASDLAEAFARVTDPAARERCLAYVRAAAGQDAA